MAVIDLPLNYHAHDTPRRYYLPFGLLGFKDTCRSAQLAANASGDDQFIFDDAGRCRWKVTPQPQYEREG